MTLVKFIVIGLPFLAAFAMCGRIFALKDLAWVKDQLGRVGIGEGVSPAESHVHRKLLDAKKWQRISVWMWSVVAAAVFAGWVVGVAWAIKFGW